ncbi:hypothetical protein B7463_g4448, partial [Scytalidium lignicola]
MTWDMDWSPDFCLACDRQTDGKAYCSEACRLSEYEGAHGSTASSPAPSRNSWPSHKGNGFYLPPAYNFSTARPYGTTPSPRASYFPKTSRPQSSLEPLSTRPTLTPSSSQSSLFSMQSTASSSISEPLQLSEESRKALKAYASSFDQSRYQRRGSA